jgi:maleylacetate reductase
MPLAFDHQTLGQRILFGASRAAENLALEVTERGAERIMVIASGSAAVVARGITANLPVEVFWEDVAQHVPIEVAHRARDSAAAHNIDLLVSVGGGSTTGLAKAIALTSGTPVISIPTTYAGSEATNVWGLTESARKTTGVDPRVLPATVIYDAELTRSLPVELSVASGLNAVAHCVDSLWAPRADPINAALAVDAIRALNGALRTIFHTPDDLAAREQALYGTYLAAVAFASAGSGMHHKICHVLGGRFALPHAETHATVLPYVLGFNASSAPRAADRIAAALGASDAVSGLVDLKESLNAPRALRDYGFAEGDIVEAALLCFEAIPASNPRAFTVGDIQELLHDAWEGRDPQASRKEPVHD